MAKVNKERKKEQIKILLSSVLNKASSNPKFEGVTIVDVKLSPDSSSAVIYYAVFGADKNIESITSALNSASGFFQSRLSKNLRSRNTPKLSFVFDKGFDHANRIDQLLNQINLSDPEIEPDLEE